jgi:hypothetical protein
MAWPPTTAAVPVESWAATAWATAGELESASAAPGPRAAPRFADDATTPAPGWTHATSTPAGTAEAEIVARASRTQLATTVWSGRTHSERPLTEARTEEPTSTASPRNCSGLFDVWVAPEEARPSRRRRASLRTVEETTWDRASERMKTRTRRVAAAVAATRAAMARRLAATRAMPRLRAPAARRPSATWADVPRSTVAAPASPTPSHTSAWDTSPGRHRRDPMRIRTRPAPRSPPTTGLVAGCTRREPDRKAPAASAAKPSPSEARAHRDRLSSSALSSTRATPAAATRKMAN